MRKNSSGESTSIEQTRYGYDGLFIRQNDYHKKYLYADILWVEACVNYSYIHLKGGMKIIVTHTLLVVERKLPCHHFARVHRHYILNLNYIDAFVGNSARIGEKLFPISDRYREALLGRFNFLEAMSGKRNLKDGEEEA